MNSFFVHEKLRHKKSLSSCPFLKYKCARTIDKNAIKIFAQRRERGEEEWKMEAKC